MSDSLVNVTVEPKELVITLVDSSSTTVELNPNPVEVTINSTVQNTVTVTLGGGRGAIWLPDGGTYDGTALAAILAGHISKTQLTNDLAEEIELTSTGLIEAQDDLQGAIDTLNATGVLVDTTVSRMEIVEDTIVLQSSRLDDVELNITTARVDIDDNIIRLTAAETSLTDNSNYIVTQQSILSNEWTVKIFENTDGSICSAGIGLLVYPAWKVNSVYEIDDYCWFDDSVYKSKIVHTSSESITPANTSYWQLIPYGTKSQFGVLANTFFVQTQKDGDIYTPFVIYEDQVVINGDMIVKGLISANLVSASGIATWSLQSHNYAPGVSGYKLDATTGLAEFNDINLELNYNPLDTSFNSWNLNGNEVVTITDGVIGNKALRLGVPQGLYPNSNMYTAIDYTKVYTVSFWAKPSSDADGLLYFSLRQYLNDTGTPGPINGGRSPYKPSGYPRAYHNTLFGEGNWGFYSFTWSSADWQTGVKYVMPEFLNNYASTTGCWYIQGFTFESNNIQTAIDNTLDTTTGGIIVRDNTLNRYAHLTGGDLEFYDYYDTGWHLYKSVTKTVTGVCSDGETVNIGYFREQPKIIISPYLLYCYNPSYPNQAQTFSLSPANLRKVNNDWLFDTQAKLVIASATVSTSGTDVTGFFAIYNPPLTITTNEVVSPQSNSYSVDVTLKVIRRYYQGSGTKTAASISAIVYLQYYTNGSWHTQNVGSLSTSYCYSSDLVDNLLCSISSAYPIEKIKAYAVYTITSYSFNVNIGTTDYITQHLQIINANFNLGASTISINGKASYLAIG